MAKKLNKAELLKLDQWLIANQACSVVELHGFLTAIISGPSIFAPKEWMRIAGIEANKMQDFEHAQSIATMLMDFYHTILQQLTDSAYKPMLNLKSLRTQKASDNERHGASLWAKGYMRGVSCDAEVWLAQGSVTIAHLLLPIISLTLFDELSNTEDNDEKRKEALALCTMGVQLLPDLVSAIHAFWLEHRQLNEVADFTMVQQEDKYGPNQYCYCGSGKTYKKCCLNKKH